MDKWQALHWFWAGFGLPVYDENYVPRDVTKEGEVISIDPPYITYEASSGVFEQPILLGASIWYMSTSWKEISIKEQEIKNAIGVSRLIPLDNGEYLYIYPGSPFSIRMRDEDPDIKRLHINIMCEYFTK